MPATAADLPQELFQDILWYAAPPLLNGRALRPPTSTNPAVRDIGRFILVSLYWASVCRPHLFESITLRSQTDFKGLLAILDVGPRVRMPPIATHIRSLDVRCTLGDPPWVHHLAEKLLPRLHSVDDMRLESESALIGVGQKAFPHPLPRSLPSFFFASIRRLALYDVHVKQGKDIIRYVTGLSQLELLYLDRFTWDVAPGLTMAHRLPKAFIRVTRKDDHSSALSVGPWFGVAMMSATAKRTHGKEWDASERSIVQSMLHLFQPDNSGPAPTDRLFDSGFGTTSRSLSASAHEVPHKRGSAYPPTINFMNPETVPLPLSRAPSATLHLRTIRFYTHTSDKANERIPSFRAGTWAAFAKLALQLQHLRVVEFSFRTLEGLSDFLDAHFAALAGLHAVGRSTYAYQQRSGPECVVDPTAILQNRQKDEKTPADGDDKEMIIKRPPK